MKKLTGDLREELKKPLGKVVDEDELVDSVRDANTLICIGDYCADVLLRGGRRPEVMVYDFKTRRGPVSTDVRGRIESVCDPVSVNNPPGVITDELLGIMQKVISEGKGDVFVDGEEDLAGLVAIAYAPIGSVVVYGMPSRGAVVVDIDRDVQENAISILNRMES
ncbi:MAG: DUF359 domain-containing protein [Candidatus Micrarchaeota archaeon]